MELLLDELVDEVGVLQLLLVPFSRSKEGFPSVCWGEPSDIFFELLLSSGLGVVVASVVVLGGCCLVNGPVVVSVPVVFVVSPLLLIVI